METVNAQSGCFVRGCRQHQPSNEERGEPGPV